MTLSEFFKQYPDDEYEEIVFVSGNHNGDVVLGQGKYQDGVYTGTEPDNIEIEEVSQMGKTKIKVYIPPSWINRKDKY